MYSKSNTEIHTERDNYKKIANTFWTMFELHKNRIHEDLIKRASDGHGTALGLISMIMTKLGIFNNIRIYLVRILLYPQ